MFVGVAEAVARSEMPEENEYKWCGTAEELWNINDSSNEADDEQEVQDFKRRMPEENREFEAWNMYDSNEESDDGLETQVYLRRTKKPRVTYEDEEDHVQDWVYMADADRKRPSEDKTFTERKRAVKEEHKVHKDYPKKGEFHDELLNVPLVK